MSWPASFGRLPPASLHSRSQSFVNNPMGLDFCISCMGLGTTAVVSACQTRNTQPKAVASGRQDNNGAHLLARGPQVQVRSCSSNLCTKLTCSFSFQHIKLRGTSAEVERMHAAVRTNRCWFDYNSEDPKCSPYLGILLSLQKRKAYMPRSHGQRWQPGSPRSRGGPVATNAAKVHAP